MRVRSISDADISWAIWRISAGRSDASEFINAASYADREGWGKEAARSGQVAGCRLPVPNRSDT
jgi:hypothetical protein